MKEVCECGAKTANPKPVKFSVDDKFGPYKRKAKINDYIKKGFI